MIEKVFVGKIIATKMQETATVLVQRSKIHPKYKKRYTVGKKYLVHNPKDAFKEGQTVEFISTKKISKRKSFIIKREVKN